MAFPGRLQDHVCFPNVDLEATKRHCRRTRTLQVVCRAVVASSIADRTGKGTLTDFQSTLGCYYPSLTSEQGTQSKT